MPDSERIVFSRRRMMWLDPFLRLYVGRRVQGVLVAGELERDPNAVNVIMAQHVGRLDGFIVRMMQRRAAPGTRLVTIMLERQLKRYPVFKRAGAFGITPGSLASARRLKQMVRHDLMAGDCVALFPQGRIETVDADPRRIHTGYRHIVHPDLPTRFIPVALSVEPLTHSKPTVFMRIGAPVNVDRAGEAFADTVDSLREWLRRHGETADASWPGYRLL